MASSHGKRSAAPTELVDVFPTLLDIAGLSQPANDAYPLDGVSLKPLLEVGPKHANPIPVIWRRGDAGMHIATNRHRRRLFINLRMLRCCSRVVACC
jgi:arylsulfatase A-like enzyme